MLDSNRFKGNTRACLQKLEKFNGFVAKCHGSHWATSTSFSQKTWLSPFQIDFFYRYNVDWLFVCSAEGEPLCVGPTKKFLSCNIQVSNSCEVNVYISKYYVRNFSATVIYVAPQMSNKNGWKLITQRVPGAYAAASASMTRICACVDRTVQREKRMTSG